MFFAKIFCTGDILTGHHSNVAVGVALNVCVDARRLPSSFVTLGRSFSDMARQRQT
jgi:hypothetical protein